MFEQASRMKLRFNTVRGNITTEDLWDLPLTSKSGVSLDDLAKALHRAIKENEEESFVTERSVANTELDLKFEIVKHVIAAKKEENESRRNMAKNKAEREKIMELIAKKQDESLESKSIEELTQMLGQIG